MPATTELELRAASGSSLPPALEMTSRGGALDAMPPPHPQPQPSSHDSRSVEETHAMEQSGTKDNALTPAKFTPAPSPPSAAAPSASPPASDDEAAGEQPSCRDRLERRCGGRTTRRILIVLLLLAFVAQCVMESMEMNALVQVKRAYRKYRDEAVSGSASRFLQLQLEALHQEGAVRGFVLTGDESGLKRYYDAQTRAAQLESQLRGVADERLLSRVINNIAARVERMDQVIVLRRQLGDGSVRTIAPLIRQNEAFLASITQDLHTLDEQLQEARSSRAHKTAHALQLLQAASVASLCGLLFFTLLAAIGAYTYHSRTKLRRRNRTLQAALAAAEETTRLKTNFLMLVNHELRTPMNGILAMAHLLAQSPLSEDQHECVSTILEAGDTMTRLLNDVLLCNALEAGRLTLNCQPCSIHAIVRSINKTMDNRLAVAKRQTRSFVQWSVWVDPELPAAVVADAERLKHVISNLLDNALKFLGHSGRISFAVRLVSLAPACTTDDMHDFVALTIRERGEAEYAAQPAADTTSMNVAHSAQECKDEQACMMLHDHAESQPHTPRTPRGADAAPAMACIEFSVADTGPGIKKEKLKAIFETFHQGDSSMTKRHGGTGLGLAVCRKLVHLMNGELSVESREDVGSRFFFTVTLPVSDVEVECLSAEAQASPPPRSRAPMDGGMPALPMRAASMDDAAAEQHRGSASTSTSSTPMSSQRYAPSSTVSNTRSNTQSFGAGTPFNTPSSSSGNMQHQHGMHESPSCNMLTRQGVAAAAAASASSTTSTVSAHFQPSLHQLGMPLPQVAPLTPMHLPQPSDDPLLLVEPSHSPASSLATLAALKSKRTPPVRHGRTMSTPGAFEYKPSSHTRQGINSPEERASDGKQASVHRAYTADARLCSIVEAEKSDVSSMSDTSSVSESAGGVNPMQQILLPPAPSTFHASPELSPPADIGRLQAPVASESPQSLSPQSSPPTPSSIPAMTPPGHTACPLYILCAEDNAINARVLLRLLARDGHRAVMVSDGEQAVREFNVQTADNRFDCVLLDLCMPVMDGLTAAKLMREREHANGHSHARDVPDDRSHDPPRSQSAAGMRPPDLPAADASLLRERSEPLPQRPPRMPIVAVTASSLLDDRTACAQAGIDDVCVKPITPTSLRAVLKPIIARKMQARAEAQWPRHSSASGSSNAAQAQADSPQGTGASQLNSTE